MVEEVYDRELGVKAIIALQAVIGVVEPRDSAEKAWDKFDDDAKLQTTLAHKMVCGGFKNDGTPMGN